MSSAPIPFNTCLWIVAQNCRSGFLVGVDSQNMTARHYLLELYEYATNSGAPTWLDLPYNAAAFCGDMERCQPILGGANSDPKFLVPTWAGAACRWSLGLPRRARRWNNGTNTFQTTSVLTSFIIVKLRHDPRRITPPHPQHTRLRTVARPNMDLTG